MAEEAEKREAEKEAAAATAREAAAAAEAKAATAAEQGGDAVAGEGEGGRAAVPKLNVGLAMSVGEGNAVSAAQLRATMEVM